MISGIDDDDIQTLAEILEHEQAMHRRKCSICFAMFLFAFCSLVVALVLVAIQLATAMSAPAGLESLGGGFALFQVLAPLAAVALSFFGAWWAAQNCLHAIERTLCAARNQRFKLFHTFLGQIKCADKEKQRAWLEIVKSAVM